MWERIIGILRSPVKTLRQTSEAELWKEGLLIVLLVSLLKWLSKLAEPGDQELIKHLKPIMGTSAADQLSTALNSTSMGFFFSLFDDLLVWVIGGLLFFLFAKLFKGRGTVVGMLAGLGYASCPYFLGAPLMAIISLTGTAGYFLSSIIGFAASIWVLVLEIIAIRESQQISTGGAVATYFIPAVLLGIIFFLLIILITAFIIMAA